MTGILYGAGVGPGDPELMTLKAVRLIKENEIIALPGPVARETVAYQIAEKAVPELAEKTLLSVDMPISMYRSGFWPGAIRRSLSAALLPSALLRPGAVRLWWNGTSSFTFFPPFTS